jgi:hypothetical protein
MHVRSGTTVVSLIRANWRDYKIGGSQNYHRTSYLYQHRIYRETGWGRLEERRTKRKLQLFYNIQNGSTPLYLLELIPPTSQSTTSYPLRNATTLLFHSVDYL